MAFCLDAFFNYGSLYFLVVKELESERELSHVEIFASGGDTASKLQVQDDSQIVDLVRGHQMFSGILKFLFAIVFFWKKWPFHNIKTLLHSTTTWTEFCHFLTPPSCVDKN